MLIVSKNNSHVLASTKLNFSDLGVVNENKKKEKKFKQEAGWVELLCVCAQIISAATHA